MNDLADATEAVSFRAEGDPPETYHVMINAVGLAPSGEGHVALRRVHRCTVYLHSGYPRRPPVVNWLTPIVHPNILPPERNGGVCLGAWSAGESLADVVRRLVDLVTYRAFNTADPLDRSAAAWIVSRGFRAGDDPAVLSDLASSGQSGEQVAVTLVREARA